MSPVVQPLPKKPWTPPELVRIPLLDTLNSPGSGSDADSASAS